MIQGIRATVKATGELIDVRKDRELMLYIDCNNKSKKYKSNELEFKV